MSARRDGIAVAHGVLRALLPERMRREHGAEMEQVFRERLVDEAPGPRRWAVWAREARDLVATGARLRWRTTTMGGGVMRGWADDVRGVVRGLARAPGFLVFSVGTLALGVGAAVTFAAFLDRIVLRPVDFPDADRLVGVWRSSGRGLMISPDADSFERMRRADVFDRVAATRGQEVVLSTETGATPVWAARMDEGLPALAGLPALIGRYFAPEELVEGGERVVVLTEGAWARRFGRDPDVLGTALTVDGEPYTVIGVAPGRLTSPMPGRDGAELWLPLVAGDEKGGLNVYAHLAPGVSLEMARERVAALDAGASEEGSGTRWETRLTPVDEMLTGFLRSPLRAVGASVALLLLIACLNTANLLLARGDARRRETALRAALGAGRLRLGREHLVESALVVTLASLVGLGLAAGAVAFVKRVRPDDLHVLDQLRLDPMIVTLAVSMAAVTAFLFGMLPLAHRLRTDPGRALADRGGTADGNTVGTRRLLLVGEVALSFALLATAVQLSASLREVRARDPGLAVDELAVVDVDLPEWRFPDETAREEILERIVDAAGRLPGVRAVGVASAAPTRPGIFFGAPEVEGGEAPSPDESVVFFGGSVGAGYFSAVGREVLEGREFVPADLEEDVSVVVLGESAAARYFPDGDAVGRRFRVGGDSWQTVVGVVRDAWITGGANDPGYPQMYVPTERGQGSAVHVRSDDPAGVLTALADVVRAADPEIPVGGATLVSTLYRNALARERMISVLLLGFSAAASLLAAVGLYGVLAQLSLRRVREYGIRISVGARRRQIFALVVRGGVAPVLAGLTLGIGLAWVGLRVLESGIVGLDGARPLPFALAAALLAVAAGLAVALPARRAAATDPVRALRAE